MARKESSVYKCRSCGTESPKWLGRCSECGEWNTYEERAPALVKQQRSWLEGREASLQELAAVETVTFRRLILPFREVNRVLGGGIVPGSLTLIGGDPGIGKSTLLLQMAQAVADADGPVVYVSGEESPQQIRMRAERLGLSGKGILILPETDLDLVFQRLGETAPALVVVDSIQTMCLSDVGGAAGSVSQVRESALRLMQWSKSGGVPVLIAGHVTKDGAIAGPRILEHMVDAVLYMEGETFSSFRILRCVKNRFGSSNEVGIFQMGDDGLTEVLNPSEAFLAHRQETVPGSAIAPTMEGSRPLLVEIQALITPTSMPAPRRVANGVDFNRLLLLIAVLSKHLSLNFSGQDILVNVVGGLRVAEPAVDAAIAMALVSSLRDKPLKQGWVAIGEVGLGGELRPVGHTERRITEAAAMGFRVCILPKNGLDRLPAADNVRLAGADTLRQAVMLAFDDEAA